MNVELEHQDGIGSIGPVYFVYIAPVGTPLPVRVPPWTLLYAAPDDGDDDEQKR